MKKIIIGTKKLLILTVFFFYSQNVYAGMNIFKFEKNTSHKKKCFEDYNSVFEKIKQNPRDVCSIINSSLQCYQNNSVLYHKNMDTNYLKKVLKNYSYCLDRSTVSSLFNTFAPKKRQEKKYFADKFERSKFSYFQDYEAAKAIYKKFANDLSDEQFISLYGYALVYDPIFADKLYKSINAKIHNESLYVCNFAKTSLFASLSNAHEYRASVELAYLENMFAQYGECYDKIQVQKLFDIVLSEENRLVNLVPLMGKRKSKTFPYADYSAAKVIFSMYPDYLSDIQLSLLYEYALAFDMVYAQELNDYFRNVIQGSHTLMYHELSKEDSSVLKQRIITVL